MPWIKVLTLLFTVTLSGALYPMSQVLEIYAHRGFASFYPENTLLGYQESIKLGVNTLDVDVALTKDEIVVASHDPFLNKDFTKNIKGEWLDNNLNLISALTFNELQDYTVGYTQPTSGYAIRFPEQKNYENIKIPSLQQIIDLIKTTGNNSHKLQIEIKTNPSYDTAYIETFVTRIIETLNKNDFLARAELQSFDWRTLIYAKKLQPKIATSFITEQTNKFDTFAANNSIFNSSWTAGYKLADFDNSIITMMTKLGANIWCPYYKNVTSKLVAEAHANNIKVVPWTADSKNDMRELINAGVDGIITNRADILRELMQELNLKLPN